MNQVEAGVWAIGVDVGGTRVPAGFVDAQSEIHQHTRVPMNSLGTAEEGLAAVTGAIDQLLKLEPETSRTPRRIGICAPPFWRNSQRFARLVHEQALRGNPDRSCAYGVESGIAGGAALCMLPGASE